MITMTNINTILNRDRSLEYCPYCEKPVLDTGHECCAKKTNENNFSDRLDYGFSLLDMED